MLQLTKIFHFETAHALHGYAGACKNIHGHSYELHVTVSSVEDYKNYIPAPGFMIDFKEIKKLVNILVVEKFDHKVILSKDFLSDNPSFSSQENLVIFEAEPTAENLLIYILRNIQKSLPANIQLVKLKLYETNDSYAEWVK
jgi:6-pyruvoyltetrahydropterin/6-carboxytetrahydropterin synthase